VTAVHQPVIDFDHHSEAYAANWERIVRDLHALDFPLAWSEAHGGFWVTGSWSHIHEAAQDWETYSADNDVKRERRGGKGSRVPQDPYQLKLSESDPPFHTARRRLEMPFMTPKALREHIPMIERFIAEAIDSVRGRERADLLLDVVLPIAARTTLNLVGYGDGWAEIARSIHQMSYVKPDDPAFPIEQVQQMQAGFRAMVKERRNNPQGDIASALAQGVVLGEPLTDEEAESALAQEEELVACLQAPLTEIKEIREACLAADIPVLLGIEPGLTTAASQSAIFRRNPHQLQGRALYYAGAIGTEPQFAEIIVEQAKAFDIAALDLSPIA